MGELLELATAIEARASQERWLPVPGWPYEVSDQGRVRRADGARRGGRRSADGLLRLQRRGAYAKTTLSRGPRRRQVSVHVLVCEVFHGPRPPGLVAAHRNGIGTDNRAANLRWTTPAANERDKVFHGRAARGERHPDAVLREVDVHAIRTMAVTGRFSHAEMARLFGVSPAAVGALLQGRTWKHVA